MSADAFEARLAQTNIARIDQGRVPVRIDGRAWSALEPEGVVIRVIRRTPCKSWRQVGEQREELTVPRHFDAVEAETEELRHGEARERAGELRDERANDARQHGFQPRLVRPERIV